MTGGSIWEAGVKSTLADGKLTLEAEWFPTGFNNLVIRENVGGLPSLANAGKSRLRGIEIEAHARPRADLDISLTYARHLARFVDYARLRPAGSVQQLAGNRLELSPRNVASAVLSYAPDLGPQFSTVLRYTGSRFLNKSNTVEAGDFLTVDGRIGWRAKSSWGKDGHWGFFIEGKNHTNRRDPVVESELGDAQFYPRSVAPCGDVHAAPEQTLNSPGLLRSKIRGIIKCRSTIAHGTAHLG